jgi:hypothetical protein
MEYRKRKRSCRVEITGVSDMHAFLVFVHPWFGKRMGTLQK